MLYNTSLVIKNVIVTRVVYKTNQNIAHENAFKTVFSFQNYNFSSHTWLFNKIVINLVTNDLKYIKIVSIPISIKSNKAMIILLGWTGTNRQRWRG